MAKRAENFDRTAWATGVSPVAKGKVERCWACKGKTDGRSFLVDGLMLCEVCADRSVSGDKPVTGISFAMTMFLGLATMIVITIVYLLMHQSQA